MLKKNNSEKKTTASHRIIEGNNINKKLDDIYFKTLEKMRYSSQIDVNGLIPKEMPRLTKKNKLQKQPNFYTINSQRNKKLSEYISLDSMFKKSPKSQSNDPPTQDASGKIVSPYKTNVKSNIFNSAYKYKLKPDLKIVTETKNSITKTDYKTKTKNNNEEGKMINNISLLSNDSENNEILSNRYQNINPYPKETIEPEYYNNNNLLESDNIINKKLTNTSKSKKNKVLNSSYSEPSFSSYKNENSKIPRIQKDYYSSMLNKAQYKNREKLIQSSIDFYLHMQKLKSKSKKKEYIYDFNKNRPKIFSEMKRIPAIISFGKIIPKETITVQRQNKRRHIIYRPKQIFGLNDDTKNIFRKGLTKGSSIKKLKQLKLIKDDYNTDDPNGQYYIPKDQFGNTVYPIFGQKKMLKNLMPKEYDYNTLKSPLELLHDTYHPLLRFQKKMLTQHINAINQEIGVTYSKHFTLVDKSKIPEKYQMCQDLIDLQKDEKLIKLIRDLIDRNFGLEKEVTKTLISQKKEKEKIKKQHIYKRISEVMLKASIHFKRLNISLEDFYSIPSYMISKSKPKSKSKKEKNSTGENIKEDEDIDDEEIQQQVTMQRNGQYFFQAIKAGDKGEILKLMKKNYYIMFYRDHFLQSPLHMIAKRNLYKYISLFISRGADINAKDEGDRTPLFIAAEQNHLEFVTVLLFEIADPAIKNIKGERPYDVTTSTKIKLILERTRILHIFHKIGKIQQFNEHIKNGLSFLYKEEMGINYKNWLKENDELVKESQKI